MTPEQQQKLIDSHDELIIVCKAAFSILVEEKKLDMIDALLQGEVLPGFAQRAEDIQDEIYSSMAFSKSLVH